MGGDGFEQVGDVVTAVEAVEYVADEPAPGLLEYGHTLGSWVPRPSFELVDGRIISRRAAERLCQVVLIVGDGMDGEHACPLRDAERAVPLGEADDEPSGVDRALG